MDFDWWWDVRTANHTLGYKSIVLSKLWRVTRSSPYIYWISEEIQSMSRDLKWAFRKQSCLHLPWYNSLKEFREEFKQQGSSVSGIFYQQFWPQVLTRDLWWEMCWVFTSAVPSKTTRRGESWLIKQLPYLSSTKIINLFNYWELLTSSTGLLIWKGLGILQKTSNILREILSSSSL